MLIRGRSHPGKISVRFRDRAAILVNHLTIKVDRPTERFDECLPVLFVRALDRRFIDFGYFWNLRKRACDERVIVSSYRLNTNENGFNSTRANLTAEAQK